MKHKREITFLLPDELLRLLKAARAHSVRAWCAILLGYKHGLRCSEICNLRLDDLDLKAQQIKLSRLKGSMTNVQNLERVQGRPLLDEVKAVRAWLVVRGNEPSPFLFTSQKGGRLDRSAIFREFQGIATATGLPVGKRNPHLLKHSLGSHLVASGTLLPFIKQALGHRSISSTMRYAHVTDQQAATEARKAMATMF